MDADGFGLSQNTAKGEIGLLLIDQMRKRKTTRKHPSGASKTFFNISVSLENFSEEEAKILKRYGGVFQRLTTGERPPETEAQERFVEVARGARNPTTIYEQAWRKYLDHSNSKNISDSTLGVPVPGGRSPRESEMNFSRQPTRRTTGKWDIPESQRRKAGLGFASSRRNARKKR